MRKIVMRAIMILGLFIETGLALELAPLPELVNPTMIEIQNDELFILEDISVQVYSLKDFKWKRTFGKKGEGPGELVSSPDLPNFMQLYKGNVLINSFSKMIYYSPSGQMIKESRIPFIAFQVMPFGDNFAAVKFSREPDGGSKALVVLYDQAFKEVKTLYENRLLNDMKKGKIAYPLVSVFIKRHNDRLYVFDQQVDFNIKVFDTSGNELPPISQPYQKIPVSEEFKKKSKAWLSIQPAFKMVPNIVRDMIYFNEFLPAIRYSQVTDGKLYIQTYNSKQGLSEFYILDTNGKFLEKIYLPGADREQLRPSPASLYAFKGNKFYYLTENIEEEEWTLNMETIKK